MPSSKLDANLKIKIDGVALSDDDMQDLIDLTVDSDYFLPTLFEFTLEDNFNSRHSALTHIDGNKFSVGARVVINVDETLEVEHETLSGLLVDGEITSLEPEFGSDGRSRLHIRGYDKSHRLMAGEKTRVFGDGRNKNISESDIFSKVCGDFGLSASIDAGLKSLRYTYVMQYEQTDWDFLWERAQQIGYQIYVQGNKLSCSKANAPRGGSTAVNLEWCKDLTSFEPCVSIVGLSKESVVSGWDPDTKKSVVGQVKKSTLSTQADLSVVTKTNQYVNDVFSQNQLIQMMNSGIEQSLASKWADANLSTCENTVVQANGYLQYGDPRVLAGTNVTISGVGKNYSGTYYVTHARHNFSRGQYNVTFAVSGTTPHTLSGLLQPGSAKDHHKVDGVVVGIVTNINDPDKLGRIQVKFPWMPKSQGADLSSSWARLASPGGGKERGILFIPEIDDEVLVAFEHGDPGMPYILGGLWNKMDTPPDGKDANLADNKYVNQRVIRSRLGHLILLNDKAGEEQILIQDKSKENSILIDTKNNAITMKSKADFTIDAGGKFTVKAKGDMVFESTGKFEITKIKSFSATALQEAVLKVSNNQLALKAAGAELSGLTVDVKASAKVSVSGNAMAEIKGGLVKIN